MIAPANCFTSTPSTLDELRASLPAPATKPRPISLADIFRPMPGGRSIRAEKTAEGTRLSFQDGFFPGGWFHEQARQWTNYDRFEITRGGICLLVAASRWSEYSDRQSFVIAWWDMQSRASWVFQSDCKATCRAIAFDVGYRFRSATGTADTDETANSVTIDNFALSVLG